MQKYQLEQTLQPDEQMWIDVGKLIREHVPDKNGSVLPGNLASGSYEFRDLTNQGIGQLFEGKVVYDKTYGQVTYGCAGCCGYVNAIVLLDPLGMLLDSNTTNGVGSLNSCSDLYDDVSDSFYGNWSTADPSIATVDYYGTHTGVAVGSTTSKTSGCLTGNAVPRCPNKCFKPGGQDNVAPTISQDRNLWFFGLGNTPPSGFTLGGITATLTANGAGAGTYVWTITNGASKMTFSNGSSSMQTSGNAVGITSTPYSTQANDVTVQLQFTPSGGSQLTATYSLSIDSPYKLVLNGFATTGAQQGPNPCIIPTPNPNGTDGYQTLYRYSMKSFFGAQITFEDANETFAKQADTYIGNNWPAYTVTPTFTATGDFTDQICAVGPTANPPTRPPQSPLGSVGIDYGSQFYFVGSLSEGSGVQVQSDTLTRYQDHGALAPITSPVR